MACEICHGRLHVRWKDTETYVRCRCYAAVVSQSYINPGIRGVDEKPDKVPVFDLANVYLCEPSNRVFRHRVWRTLLVYEPQNLVYAFLYVHRMVEIYFGRDTDYASIREIHEIPLLIVVGGVTEVKNGFMGQVLVQTLRIRVELGLPTWVYMPSVEWVTGYYGLEVVRYLEAFRDPSRISTGPVILPDVKPDSPELGPAALTNQRSATLDLL